MSNQLVLIPPPLPTDWDAARVAKKQPSLIDQVEAVMRELDRNADYQALLVQVQNKKSVHGKLSVDDTVAAQMIQAQARKNGYTMVANAQLAKIMSNHSRALGRYHQNRRQRKAEAIKLALASQTPTESAVPPTAPPTE